MKIAMEGNFSIALNISNSSEGTEQRNYQSNANFDVWMGVFIPGVVCILGIIGNVISLIVLSCDRGNYPTFFSLKALAASDILLLFSAIWQQAIPMFCVYLQSDSTFCRNMGYVRVYTWPVICIAQMNSIWLTVIISAERYNAICRPLHAKRVQDSCRVQMSVVCLIVVSLAFNLPRFFEFVPVQRQGANNLTSIKVGDTALRLNIVYRYLYNTALYCLVIYIIPLVTLTFLNVNIMVQMRKAARCWGELNRLQQRELRATAIPLCIVAVFFLCGTQALICFTLDAIFVHNYLEWLERYIAMANLLVMLNSAVNFIIFYMFGSKFRRLLKHAVYCKLYAMRMGMDSPIFRKRFATTASSRCTCHNSPSLQLIEKTSAAAS